MSVFAIAGIAPVFLIIRWRHWGVIGSVLLGWALVHFLNKSYPFDEPVEAVFAGLWAAIGWLYMLLWCLPIYVIVLVSRWILKRRQRDG